MDAYFNAIGQANQAQESYKQSIDRLNAAKQEKVAQTKDAIEAFGEPLLGESLNKGLHDTISRLGRAGANELERRGVIPEGTTENLGKIAVDLKEGGINRVIKNQVSPRLQEGVDDAVSKAQSTLGQLSDVLPPDLLKAPKGTSNPFSFDSFNEAEDFKIPTSTSSFSRVADIQPVAEDTLDNILRPDDIDPFSTQKTLSSSFIRNSENFSANTIKTGANEEKANIGKSLEKGLKEGAEVDGEGGGPEDLLGDALGAVVGIGTTLGGIFGPHAHEAEASAQNLLNPAAQLGIR